MVKRLIFVLVLVVLIFGGIFAVKYVQSQKMAEQMARPQPPAAVAVTEVQREAWRPSLSAVGSLVAVNGIGVSTEVAGIVSDIRFESGQRVEKDTVLVTLDDEVDRAALETLRAAARLAQVQFNRAADLLPQKAVSQSAYDEAKASLDTARAEVARQEAVIRRKAIRAPFDGILGIRQVDIGQYVEPGQRLVNLQALEPIYVDYTLPERNLREIAEGQVVAVELDALPGQTHRGSISAIEPGIDEGTRSVRVRATLPNPERRLRPGMFAEVLTYQEGEREVLTVPRTAVSFNTYGNFVYVIESGEDGALKVNRRQVSTGASRAGRVAVTDGLEVGERIVEAGLVKLRPGQAVKIDNSVALQHDEVEPE